RHHQLPGLAVDELLDSTTVQRLAIARALDQPCGRRPVGRLLRQRRLRGGDEDGERRHDSKHNKRNCEFANHWSVPVALSSIIMMYMLSFFFLKGMDLAGGRLVGGFLEAALCC